MKKILLIHTGGTMGMTPGQNDDILSSHFIDEIFQYIPGARDIAEIDFQSCFTVDSSNISIPHWIELGSLVSDQIERYDGFVIIHGTDTMSYTASALSFMLNNLPKPVILTGSQRPLSVIRTDAKNNLINAIELATYDIPEVGIFFDYKLFRGNRAKKISIDDFDAYASPNYPLLAEVGLRIEVKNNHRSPGGIFRLDRKFGNEVLCLRIFPGMNPSFLDYLLSSQVKVVIFEAFGAGNVPVMDGSLIPFIEKMTSAGKLVALSSQSMNGSVDLQLYDCGRSAQKAGALSCGDMTTEAAIIKAMYLLGQFDGQIQKVRSNFTRDLAGEITEA